jgi:hypothetical protein
VHLTVLAAQLAAPLLLHLVALMQRQLLPTATELHARLDGSRPQPADADADADADAEELVSLQLLAEFARRSTESPTPVKPRRGLASKTIVRPSSHSTTRH